MPRLSVSILWSKVPSRISLTLDDSTAHQPRKTIKTMSCINDGNIIFLQDDSKCHQGLDALLCCSDQEAKGRIQSKWNHAFIMTLYHRYYSICLLSYIIYIDEFSISALHMFQGTALQFVEEPYILLEYVIHEYQEKILYIFLHEFYVSKDFSTWEISRSWHLHKRGWIAAVFEAWSTRTLSNEHCNPQRGWDILTHAVMNSCCRSMTITQCDEFSLRHSLGLQNSINSITMYNTKLGGGILDPGFFKASIFSFDLNAMALIG